MRKWNESISKEIKMLSKVFKKMRFVGTLMVGNSVPMCYYKIKGILVEIRSLVILVRLSK